MTNSFPSLLIFIADHDRYARRKGQKMYFTSRKHKICHSERSEESAEARTRSPNGAIGAAMYGRRGAGPAARRPPTDPRGIGFFAALRMTNSLRSLLIFISENDWESIAVGCDRRTAQYAKRVCAKYR